MSFKNKLQDLIILFEKWLSDPQDSTQLLQWKDSALTISYSFDFSSIQQSYIDRIIDMYLEQLEFKIKNYKINDNIPSQEELDSLLNQKQIEQRTEEWYKQMVEIISASELGNLFASPRQRAKLVISKTVPYVPRNQSLAVLSDYMSPFDWGIRFEPVVKLIYEYKYHTVLKELGRLYHPYDSRCTASPDGLVYSCPKKERTGRLIEIKCPVTREIDGTIPKDYYSQMQMQLHVTQLQKCDYVEAEFSSKYNQLAPKEGPSEYSGFIALIRYSEFKDNQEFYYLYSPVNCDSNWKPNTSDEIIELIPWRLIKWSEQLVTRNEEWWTSLCPMIDRFWEDVEKAKKGEFVVPESTRAPKKSQPEKCLIVFHKMDENGQKISTL